MMGGAAGPGGSMQNNSPHGANSGGGGAGMHNGGGGGYQGAGGLGMSKDLAPRFKRNLISSAPTDPADALTFRPSAGSLLFKVNVNINKDQLPLGQQPRSNGSGIGTAATTAPGGGSNNGGVHASSGGVGLNNPVGGGGGGNNPSSPYNNSGNNGNASLSAGQNYHAQGHSNDHRPLNHNNPLLSGHNNNNNNFGSSDQHSHHHHQGGAGTLAPSTHMSIASKLNPPQPVNNLLKKDQILIKQASLEKPKQTKKDKGPFKEDILKRVQTFVAEYFINAEAAAAAAAAEAEAEAEVAAVAEKLAKASVVSAEPIVEAAPIAAEETVEGEPQKATDEPTAEVDDQPQTEQQPNNNPDTNTSVVDNSIDSSATSTSDDDAPESVAAAVDVIATAAITVPEVVPSATNNSSATATPTKTNAATLLPSGNQLLAAFVELKVPEKFMRDTMTTVLDEIIDKSDAVHERCFQLLVALRRDGKLATAAVLDGFRGLLKNDAIRPRIATQAAALLCRAVIAQLLRIQDVAQLSDGGQHYPLFLLVLQQLHKQLGKAALLEAYAASKVQLMGTLCEADRNKDRMAAILQDRGLSYLYPLLKLQGELQKQIEADANPAQLYKWIKENVDATCYADPGFITAVMNVLLKHITGETTLAEGVDRTKSPDKALMEQEKRLLERYSPVLQAFLRDQQDLELVAIYVLQSFCHAAGFPKGMLLRWFTALYDLEVVEEESFMRWKEDLNDVYPGKGQALFQVNTYLTWLEQEETDDDDDDDE